MSPTDVQGLIARCLSGDDQARAQFCAEYYDLVLRAVARKLSQILNAPPPREEVEDICNEVFVHLLADDCRAMRRLHRPASLNAWLVTVARNLTVDCLRKRGSRLRLEDATAHEPVAPHEPAPDQTVMAQEQQSAVGTKMAELPALDRLILELYYLHSLKYAEIASMLGMNPNTVASRVRRAKEKLRKLLAEDDNESTATRG